MQCQTHKRYKGKRKPTTDCVTCHEIWQHKQLEKENARLTEQLATFQHCGEVSIHPFRTKQVVFGVISDTHMGSLYENLPLLRIAYKVFEAEGVKRVYHAGDLLDGEKIYRGHDYELHTLGADNQVNHCVKNYPKVKGLKTFFITGNHDLSHYKRAGVDVGKHIASRRDDMVYLGPDYANVDIKNQYGKVRLMLIHPSGGTAYALSYKLQKMIESFTGGQKPNILVSGHFHKSEFLPHYRNVEAFQAGCIQKQTPFMQGKQLAAMMGFWIIGLTLNGNSIVRCKAEFFPYYA